LFPLDYRQLLVNTERETLQSQQCLLSQGRCVIHAVSHNELLSMMRQSACVPETGDSAETVACAMEELEIGERCRIIGVVKALVSLR
jgi:hypothetical protein